MNSRALYLSCVVLYFSLIQIEEYSASDVNGLTNVLPSICSKQCGPDIANTKTGVYCHGQNGKIISGRCCVSSKDDTVVGIDLQNCWLNKQTLITAIENMTELVYISLNGNYISHVTSEDFHRNTKIAYLSLPQGLLCPGSDSAWNDTRNSTGFTECIGESDMCKVHNVTCPENSHCEPSGIDQVECLCDAGYHGYKCMNQGTFPTLAFVLGLTIPTVVLSALLWVTQRRYVKTSNKNK